MSGVLVDTCIWSGALRGKQSTNERFAQELMSLIDDGRAKIIGVIRQELLSGYSNEQRYESLRKRMNWFPNELINDSDYEQAAAFSNICRRKGIQGSHIDFLICAVSVRLDLQIFTVDQDFEHYIKHLPINLYQLSRSS